MSILYMLHFVYFSNRMSYTFTQFFFSDVNFNYMPQANLLFICHICFKYVSRGHFISLLSIFNWAINTKNQWSPDIKPFFIAIICRRCVQFASCIFFRKGLHIMYLTNTCGACSMCIYGCGLFLHTVHATHYRYSKTSEHVCKLAFVSKGHLTISRGNHINILPTHNALINL